MSTITSLGMGGSSAADMFKKLDKNGDGVVNAQDMGLGESESLTGSKRGQSIHNAIAAMDGDGDGQVTESEFSSFFSSVGQSSSASASTRKTSLLDYIQRSKDGSSASVSGTEDTLEQLLLNLKKATGATSNNANSSDDISTIIEKLKEQLAQTSNPTSGLLVDVDA